MFPHFSLGDRRRANLFHFFRDRIFKILDAFSRDCGYVEVLVASPRGRIDERA